MTDDLLEAILQHATNGAKRLTRRELDALAGEITRLDRAEFIEAAALAPGLEWDGDQDRPKGYLEIHGREWWIDVSKAENRLHLLTVVTAVALVDGLRLPFSTAWVTRVLTSVLTLDSAGFDESGLHMTVQLHSDPRLPFGLTEIVNHLDYADFLDTVENAGETMPLSAGGTISIVKKQGSGTGCPSSRFIRLLPGADARSPRPHPHGGPST